MRLAHFVDAPVGPRHRPRQPAVIHGALQSRGLQGVPGRDRDPDAPHASAGVRPDGRASPRRVVYHHGIAAVSEERRQFPELTRTAAHAAAGVAPRPIERERAQRGIAPVRDDQHAGRPVHDDGGDVVEVRLPIPGRASEPQAGRPRAKMRGVRSEGRFRFRRTDRVGTVVPFQTCGSHHRGRECRPVPGPRAAPRRIQPHVITIERDRDLKDPTWKERIPARTR